MDEKVSPLAEKPRALEPADDAPLHDEESRTFHPFPKLPLELRKKIWGMCEVEPCLITHMTRLVGGADNEKVKVIAVQRRVPSVLQVCRESRQEWFEDPKATAPRISDHPLYVLFAFTKNRKLVIPFCAEIDSVTLTFAAARTPNLTNTLRHIVVAMHYKSPLRISEFKNLQTLTIIHTESASGRLISYNLGTAESIFPVTYYHGYTSVDLLRLMHTMKNTGVVVAKRPLGRSIPYLVRFYSKQIEHLKGRDQTWNEPRLIIKEEGPLEESTLFV